MAEGSRDAFMQLHKEKLALESKLSIAVEALEHIAKPALGGKAQQYDAQTALQRIKERS